MFHGLKVNLCTAQYFVAIASATRIFDTVKELDFDYDCNCHSIHISVQRLQC